MKDVYTAPFRVAAVIRTNILVVAIDLTSRLTDSRLTKIVCRARVSIFAVGLIGSLLGLASQRRVTKVY
jgi:hypothetical protein